LLPVLLLTERGQWNWPTILLLAADMSLCCEPRPLLPVPARETLFRLELAAMANASGRAAVAVAAATDSKAASSQQFIDGLILLDDLRLWRMEARHVPFNKPRANMATVSWSKRVLFL